MAATRYFRRGGSTFALAASTLFYLFISYTAAQSGPCFDAPDGTACDLGLYCTIGDYCDEGVCVFGEPRDCSHLTDQCNIGTCIENSDACFSLPVENGTPCSDASGRTIGDYCWNGACLAGEPVTCSELDDQCNIGVWSYELEQCVTVPLSNGTACEDGFFCTVDDYCALGQCMSGASRDCSVFTNQCNVGACNEHAQICEALHVQNGSPCIGSERPGLCTIGDTCQCGTCMREVAEAGTLCRQGDEPYRDCNPSEFCNGNDGWCPDDINFYHLERCQQYPPEPCEEHPPHNPPHLPPHHGDGGEQHEHPHGPWPRPAYTDDDDGHRFPSRPNFDDDDGGVSGVSWVAWLIGGILVSCVVIALIYACWNSSFGYGKNDEYTDPEAGRQQFSGSKFSAEEAWIARLGQEQKNK